VVSSQFYENVEFGIHIENDFTSNITNLLVNNQQVIDKDRIKAYKLIDGPMESDLIIKKSVISTNFQSGIYFNNVFIFLEEVAINDNIDYAFYTPKEEFIGCIKLSKLPKTKNTILGNFGGPWGEINYSSKFSCGGCFSNSTNRHKKNKSQMFDINQLNFNKKDDKDINSNKDSFKNKNNCMLM
jgi:hypothetical protein